ncbi:agamous-like MADS-box protein AGL82 [Cicer arietinum]|uniref:MADS-box protein FLOWERING LOCUS C-like n=1 Tax=Cicer arietinum TaxID=3827 RepID=A0A1S2XEX6_CICAR|nr:MADS-box protein FLOWERING LOCUS C-like [Cicer arietinum]
MGRPKTNLKRIQNEKARKTTFVHRKNGLSKKVSEFSSIFGAEVCLIVYDSDGSDIPMTFPENATTVQSMLKKYEHQKIETTLEEFGVKDYYANKKNLVEAQISRVRKEILKKKYPTSSPIFNNMEEEQLKAFIAFVDSKIEACNHMLKNMQQKDTCFVQNMAQDSDVCLHSSQDNVVMHSLPHMQHITDCMEPTNDEISEWIDFSDLSDLPPVPSTNQLSKLVDWDDMKIESEEFTSFIQNTMQNITYDNILSSHSSQLDVNHNIPQMQNINGCMLSLYDDICDTVDFTDLIDWDNIVV